jgi:DNA-binding transcriptional ArsR family regulator
VPTRERVAELLRQGLSRAEAARRLGLTKSTVSYHARRLGEEIDDRCRRRYDWSAVQTFYDGGHTVRECQQAFGFSSAAWTDAVRRGLLVSRPRFKPQGEVFAVGTHRNRGHLKRRLIDAGLKEERCERCGISEWLDEPLTISLHHVNGDRLDNRVENLELLCPNCHSQTDTFGGRNGRRGSRRRVLIGTTREL